MASLQAIIRAAAPRADQRFVAALTPAADKAAQSWGVMDAPVLAAFLANCHHETAGWRSFTENMNYSASRIRQVWPSRPGAVQFAGDPVGLASFVYGGRMGNRPYPSQDGWIYRGGGAMQHTGKAEYDRVLTRTGHDAATIRNPANAVAILDAAASYFADRKVSEAARRGDLELVTRRINGGLIGHQDRVVLTRRYAAIIAREPAPREVTRSERVQRDTRSGAAIGAGAGAGGTATTQAPDRTPEQIGLTAPQKLLVGGLCLLGAAVAVALIIRAVRMARTLAGERARIIEMRAAAEETQQEQPA